MIAPCGLDCSICRIHLALNDREIANQLTGNFISQGHKDAKPEWFHCAGCPGDRVDHWSADCQILKCCVDEKHLQHCDQCPKFVCERLERFANDGHKHHKEAVEYLKCLLEKAIL